MEQLFQQLASWSDVQGLFCKLTGLAEERSRAHANSGDLVEDLERARGILELHHARLQKVGATVLEELALECSICMAPLSDSPVETLACGHVFHIDCVKTAISHS